MKRSFLRFLVSTFFLIVGLGFTGCATNGLLDKTDRALESAGAERDLTVFDAPERFVAAPAFLNSDPPLDVADSMLALFQDPGLDAAVSRALNANPDLRSTALRLQEAGFRSQQAGAGFRPQVNASGSGGRQKQQGSGERNSFTASLDVAWELDVWGKLAAGRAAAEADEAAAASDLAAARESVAAQVMQQWFTLVTAKRLVELTDRRLTSLQETEALIDDRFEFGEGSLRDLDFAKTDTALARGDLEARKNEVSQAARSLEVLAGSYPAGSIPQGLRLPDLSTPVAPGVPASVVGRRPDVRAAWERVWGADARVREAELDRYPAFSLTGNFGRSSEDLVEIISNGFSFWSIAGQVLAPLVDGGRRKADVGVNEARLEQAIANYESVLLQAYREIEDALASERQLAREEAEVQRALDAARRAEETTHEDYEEGLVEILSLLEVQRRVFSTEDRLIRLRNSRLQNRVRLGLALGLGV